MRLVALDASASVAGLSVGQSLSDARALCPELNVREIDRPYLEQAFADFADWHSNASPIVSILTDAASWGDLVLDITGVSHLFGGEHRMLDTLVSRLTELGYTVNGSIAPTVGTAWALSHFATRQIVDDDPKPALMPLPVAALRLADDQVDKLNHLGLKQIGQLLGRDRKTLQARFGASLLLRLDQAMGIVEERITPRLPLAQHFVERRFGDPVILIDDVLMTARDLAFTLCSRLEGEASGAQSFNLFLYRVDHKVMTLSVNAARATRDPSHIARLFANRAESLEGDYDAGFGVDMIRLAAGSVSPLGETQIDVFDTRDGTADLDHLYDRMASRLGPLSIVRSKFVNTHIPEKSIRLEPVVGRTPDDPHAAPDAKLKRPLRLLPKPEQITVAFAEVPDGPPPNMTWRRVLYRFVKAAGPERIGVEWWTLPQALVELPPQEIVAEPEPIKTETAATDSPAPSGRQVEPDKPRPPEYAVNDGIGHTRDYYVAEDETGRRFWLFREGLYGNDLGQRWYLHGFFA